jgi:CHAD domain-containing protein
MTVERPLEIELKYAVADRTIGERLLNADTLAGFRAVGAPRPTQHEDRYIDSADGAMARAGYAARLRTASSGTVVTVKSIEESEGSLHRREELEGPADRTPEAAGWPASAARSLILELCGDAPLVELVTIRQFRRKRDLELPNDEAAVELSLDEVDVVSRGRVVERFLELELELTRGSVAALAPLQALLDGHHGLSPAPGSKLTRALLAARPTSRSVARPRPPEPVARRAPSPAKPPEPPAEPAAEPERTAAPEPEPTAAPGPEPTAGAVPAVEAEPEVEVEPAVETESTPTEAEASAEVEPGADGDAEATAASVAADEPRPSEPMSRPQPTSEDGPVEGAVIDLEALDDTPELIEEAEAVPPPMILGTPSNAELIGAIPVGKSPGIAADDLHAEAGRKVLRFHLARMLAREEGTRDGTDPEELHGMRVSTRRMRAGWRVFGDGFRPDRTQKFRRRLRTVAARLGTVRDLDVLIEATVTFAAALPTGERDGLDPLIDSWREQRDAGRRLLIRELDSPGYRRFVEEYSEFVLSPGAFVLHVDPTSPHRVRDTAGSRIWNAYEQVRAYESVLKWADVPTLHQLRIEAKRLRYTLEFVREALGPEAPALISRVVALQDHLGAMNDAEIGAHMARSYLVEHAGDLTDAQSSAISRYLVAREREVARLKRTVGVPWRSVAGLTFRRALGRTIATL